MTHHLGPCYRPARFRVRPYTRRERIVRWFDRHQAVSDLLLVAILAAGMLCVLWWLLVAPEGMP